MKQKPQSKINRASRRSKSKAPRRSGRVQKPVTAMRNYSTRNANATTQTIVREEWIGSYLSESDPFHLIPVSASFPGLDLNPGNPLLFPWLSHIAQGYEKYRFNSVQFELIPGNPTTSSGRHYMAFDYDWEDPPATTSVDFMNNSSAVSGSMWEPLALSLNINRLNEIPWRFVSDNTRSEEARRLVFAGYLMVATDNLDDSTFDLKVRYSVTLSSPCLPLVVPPASVAAPMTLGAGAREMFYELPEYSGLRTVISGVNAPAFAGMSNATGASRGLGYAMPAQLQEVQISVTDSKAAATPSSYTPDTQLGVRFFDRFGVDLGTIQNIITTIGAAAVLSTIIPCGVEDVTTWAVNGGLVRRIAHIALSEVRAVYPLAAYFVPYLISTAGQTLSTTDVSVHAEL